MELIDINGPIIQPDLPITTGTIPETIDVVSQSVTVECVRHDGTLSLLIVGNPLRRPAIEHKTIGRWPLPSHQTAADAPTATSTPYAGARSTAPAILPCRG